MNKKKSRKNRKRRDNENKPGNKSTQSQSQSKPKTKTKSQSYSKNKFKSNDKYLDNFNLSEHQQSAIKFLSEALSISSQEAHIICNECKWEQSEFPSNLEDAQSMLHWNKNNTKSKRRREQNKHRKQDPNKQKSINHSNKAISPIHSPSKSPSKSNHNKPHPNPSSPRCTGFIPHNTPNKPQAPNTNNHNNTVSNRCLLKSASRYSHNEAMNSNMSPPNNVKIPVFTRYRGRGRSRGSYPVRGHPPYVSRGRGRGRSRGRMNNNMYHNNAVSDTIHNSTRRRVTPSPPPSSKSIDDPETTNNNNMYLNHEALEQELRCKQQYVKIPKEYEKDLHGNISEILPPVENGDTVLKKDEDQEQHHGSRMMTPEHEKNTFIGHDHTENAVDEFKDQSFTLIKAEACIQSDNTHDLEAVETKNIVDIEEKDGIYMNVDDKYTELFQILNGTLIIGYRGDMKPPHLCMTFESLLDLVNYQNGEILTNKDLMQWYKKSKEKLIYTQNEDGLNHQSTQTLFDEIEEKKNTLHVHNGREKEAEMNRKVIQIETDSEENVKNVSLNTIAMKSKQRKPTRPPISANKYNVALKEVNSLSAPNEIEISKEITQQNALNRNAKTFEPKVMTTPSYIPKNIEQKERKSNKILTPTPNLNLTKRTNPPYHQQLQHVQQHVQHHVQHHDHRVRHRTEHIQSRQRQPPPPPQIINVSAAVAAAAAAPPLPIFNHNIYKQPTQFMQQSSPRTVNDHMQHHYAPTSYILTNNGTHSRILTAPNLHINALQNVGGLPPLTHQCSNTSMQGLPQYHQTTIAPPQPDYHRHHHPHHQHHHRNGQPLLPPQLHHHHQLLQ